MSSFMVTTTTMQHVVAGIFAGHRGKDTLALLFDGNYYHGQKGLTDLGNALFAMNGLALHARYGMSDPAPAFRFDMGMLATPALVEHYKAMQCFLYQCSEGNIPESSLFQAVDDAAGLLARRIVEQSAAYEDAPWGHSDPNPTPVAVAAKAPASAEVVAISKLSQRVDADAVLALEREEMIDLLLTTHWDQMERSSSHLRRLPAQADRHLFGISARGEGYFLVWKGPGEPSVLNREHFRQITDEAREAALKPPFHVYARISTYSGPNIEFYQIPDRILEKLGFNTTVQPFSTGEAEEEAADSAA